MLELDIRNVQITESENDKLTVDHYRKENETWEIYVSDDNQLIIKQKSKLQIFSFTFGLPNQVYRMIDIKIPKSWQIDLDIKTNTGRVNIENQSAKGLNIQTDTCAVIIKQSHMKSVDIKVDTGTVKIEDAYAPTIDIDTDTGTVDMKGAYQDYGFDLATDTGRVMINSQSKGKNYVVFNEAIIIKVRTDTGSIKVTFK